MERTYFLKTDRIGFSRWTEADLPLAQSLWGDPAVTKYICASGSFTQSDIENRLQKELETEQLYGIQYWPIFELASGEIIGCCGLHPHGQKQLEIGFHLRPRFWGQGLAAEAAQAVISCAFETFHTDSLFAGHNPQNVNSEKVLKKLGFVYIGDEYYAPTGLNHPSYILENPMAHHFAVKANGKLSEMIFQRKSCRSFSGRLVEPAIIDNIRAFEMKPLYPEIKVHWDIVPRSQVKCICPWTTPQVITIYSEEAEGCLENVGFLFQQMDLYLQALGLGVCWLGMGRMNPKNAPAVDGMKFVIMLAFGHPKGDHLRHDRKGFKRKSMEQITDKPDPRLEPARLAPSAVNSQPWYFTHAGDTIHVYCSRKGSRLDAGIALAHLYTANEKRFRFFKAEAIPEIPSHSYIGSFTI